MKEPTTREVVAQRLASAAGHLKGVERMTREDAHCIDLIRQIQAVQAALNKASTMLLDGHLRTCLAQTVRGADAAERERMLYEVMAIFEMSGKLNLSPFQGVKSLMNSKTFIVPNISCGHCTHTVETEGAGVAGVTSVKADKNTKQVTVAWEPPATWEQIAAVLQEVNYPPEGLIQIN